MSQKSMLTANDTYRGTVIDVSEMDAYYSLKHHFIGQTGTAAGIRLNEGFHRQVPHHLDDYQGQWMACNIIFDSDKIYDALGFKSGIGIGFFLVKVKLEEKQC